MANATASDVSVHDLVLNGGKLRADVSSAISTTSLYQTITGASTLALSLFDPDRKLLNSDLCQDRTTVGLSDLTFELAQVQKAAQILTLTFEDHAVAVLRRHKEVVKAAAGTTSRVEFCRRLIARDAPWIVVDGPKQGPVILEEIGVGTTASDTAATVADPTAIDPNTDTLTPRQAAQLLYDAGFRGGLIPTFVAIGKAESQLQVKATNGIAYGWLQINKNHGYSQAEMFDPAQNAIEAYHIYTSTLGQASGGLRQWTTYTNGAYKQYLSVGEAAAAKVNQAAAGTEVLQATPKARKQTTTKEDHWTAIQRIMGAINWRVFARRGHIVIAPDSWLLDQDGITINEATDGVDNIDFDVDRGKKVATVTVTCRAKRWSVLPGEPVTVEKLGPADDTYLTSSITRSLASSTATVTLTRKQKALPEPTAAGDTGSGGLFGKVSPTGIGSASPDVRRYVDFALAQQGKPYVWGGTGPDGYDCSGLVYAATKHGGHQIPARTAAEQYQVCLTDQRTISVAQAKKVCGALLFAAGSDGAGQPYGIGHVVISLGNGQVMAAESHAAGVGVFPASVDPWMFGALPPGFTFN